MENFKSVGKNVTVHSLAKIICPENISIGDESVIDDFTFLYATGKGIEIGKFCHIIVHSTLMAGGKIKIDDFSTIAPGCMIFAETDDYINSGLVGLKVFDEEYRKLIKMDVTIQKHVHIGAGCIIMPGVTIGEGTTVGAGSIVTKSLPVWSICYGVPCKAMKDRISMRQKQIEMEKKFLEKYYKGK